MIMVQAPKWSPNFIGVGAERCATTWCWYCLNEHPEICMTHPKEVNYFNIYYYRGETWYRGHFAHDNRKCSGEMNPLYMYSPEVSGRIAHDYPDTKILVILRNPFDRAMDRLLLDLQNIKGGIDGATLDQAKELTGRQDEYLKRSLYFQALKPYFDHFGREQILIFYYDDLEQDFRNFLRKLYISLNVDPTFLPPSADESINISGNYRCPFLYFSLQKLSQMAKSHSMTNNLLTWIHKNTGLREWFFRVITVDKGSPNLEFVDVFGTAVRDIIIEDLELLTQELKIPIPANWINETA